MKAHEFITEEIKQRLDAKCWKGYKKQGTKIKGGVRVNNCVPNESVEENFADGKNPQDKGDAKRHGVNTNASVSSLRKTAKEGGRKGQLAHWPANMKSGKAKKEGVTEGYKFKGGFPFDVDHMPGSRGINLPLAPTKKFFTDKQKWSQTVNDINSSKYNDNSEYIGMTGRSTVSIDGREWARWSDAEQKGYIELSSMSEQGMSEGLTLYQQCNMIEETAAWKRKEGKNKKGGLNDKGIASYRKENPGSKLQKAVTTPPSKLKPGSKDAKRRKSFCARMGGMKGPMKKDNGEPTRKALALRKWNCESVEHFAEMFVENMDRSKNNQAVPELKAALIARKEKLQSATEDQVYDIIDSIMTRIAKSHGVSGQKLHDMWVKEYDQDPDTWITK